MIKRAGHFFLFIISLVFALPVWADQLIIEPDRGRGPIIQAMQQAQYSIKLVMYGLTDDSLLNTLIEQKQQGKTVNVILEQAPYKANDENSKAIHQFNTYHVAWKGSVPPYRLIHQKTLLLDDKKALVMTFNFTRSTFKNERNFALIVDQPRVVHDIAAIFSADWNRVPSHVQSESIVVSPDNSRDVMLGLIQRAKQSMHIYAQNISDYKTIGALAKAARRGVSVSILTSAPLREKQAAYLQKSGINIRYSKHYYIHAKVMLIDNKKAIIGSLNFTKNSFDNNRELAVISEDPAVIKQLNNVFAEDWREVNKSENIFTDKRTEQQALHMIKRYVNKLYRNIVY